MLLILLLKAVLDSTERIWWGQLTLNSLLAQVSSPPALSYYPAFWRSKVSNHFHRDHWPVQTPKHCVPGGSDHGHHSGAFPTAPSSSQWPAIYLCIIHGLNGTVVGGAERGKVDQHIYLWVFLHGIGHVLEDRDQDLFVTPVKLLLMVSAARKAEGSGQPVRVGEGEAEGRALSRRWKSRVSALKEFPSMGKDPPGI